MTERQQERQMAEDIKDIVTRFLNAVEQGDEVVLDAL